MLDRTSGLICGALNGSAAASRTTCLINHRGKRAAGTGARRKKKRDVGNLLENVVFAAKTDETTAI